MLRLALTPSLHRDWLVPVLQGTCGVCRVEPATRQCDYCIWDEHEENVRVDPYKGYGLYPPPDDVRYRPKEYCFACFALEHRRSREVRRLPDRWLPHTRTHTHTVAGLSEFCHYADTRTTAVGVLWLQLRTHTFSLLEDKPAPTLSCVECSELATHRCHDCDENYCDSCYDAIHAKGRKKFHKWKRFSPGWPPCIECESLPATRTCDRCQDPYCDACFQRTHSKGKKKGHKFTLIKEELVDGYDYCASCEVLLGTETCEDCSKVFCDACKINVRPC